MHVFCGQVKTNGNIKVIKITLPIINVGRRMRKTETAQQLYLAAVINVVCYQGQATLTTPSL